MVNAKDTHCNRKIV